MLFSNSEVAKFIDDTFEPVWESVRPAPRVTIDFGNGHKIVRTLQGNVATYVCAAEGTVYDILPGIYTPKPYRDQLTLLASFVKDVSRAPAAQRGTRLREYHARHAARLKAPVPPVVQATARIGGAGKGGIGGLGGNNLGGGLGGFGGLGGNPAGFAGAPTPTGIEGPLEAVLAGRPVVGPTPQGGDLTLRADLAFDVQVNETVRRRLVHEHLTGVGLPRPEDLKRWLFRDVLRADLDDPLLGLGPVLSAGYPFAAEERAAAK